MLNWLEFMRIMCLFLLRKDLLTLRFEFILNFLHLRNPEELQRAEYI